MKLAEWARTEILCREGQAKKCGAVLPREDPEIKAKIHPPALSMESWSVVSEKSAGTGRSKRSATSSDDKMLVEVPEAALAEIQRLRTELAIAKQKYQVDQEAEEFAMQKRQVEQEIEELEAHALAK